MRISLPGIKMSSIIRKILLVGAALCQVAIAQTTAPATSKVDLHIVQGAATTIYLDGSRPVVKRTAKGLSSYLYRHGRPALAVHADGSYARYLYENGAMDRIAYSDGTVRRAGAKLTPSAGGSIAARGGVTPMSVVDGWDDDWWRDNGYYYQSDDSGRWDVDFPDGGRPDGPLDRMECLAAAMRTLEIAFAQVCPIMKDQSLCLWQAMMLHEEELRYCMQ